MGFKAEHVVFTQGGQGIEGSRLELHGDGSFYLGQYQPSIIMSDSKIVIGCKSASAEAFDKLCKMWMEFREGNRRRIIQ